MKPSISDTVRIGNAANDLRIAETRRVSLNQLVAEVDGRREGNLSSALRLLVLETLKAEIRSTPATHG